MARPRKQAELQQVNTFSQSHPWLTDFDLHLHSEGKYFRGFEKLGCHFAVVNGEAGAVFAVWAPNAREVSVIGNFNGWNAGSNFLHCRGDSGIWEGFIPGIQQGEIYKFVIRSRDSDYHTERADPYAFFSEIAPKTASIAWDLSQYQWNDNEWMRERNHRNALEAPISIYEIHLGSWRRVPEDWDRSLSYRELAAQLPAYLQETGFTHVELLPIMEHPFGGSWGYQPLSYFAPTSRFGTPDDFMYLVDTLHQHGIGVILDWVPAHFPNDEHGLAYFDGTHLYEHSDPKLGTHPDWGTVVFKAQISGSISNTSMGCGWMLSHRCSISITPANRANGSRTSTGEERI
jgi:1,4-alpha-glucan branching enzyme